MYVSYIMIFLSPKINDIPDLSDNYAYFLNSLNVPDRVPFRNVRYTRITNKL